MRASQLACAAIALSVIAATARLQAHPGADTDVQLSFNRPGYVEVHLTTSALGLLLKLEALAGEAGRRLPDDRPRLLSRIHEFQQTLLSHVSLRSGGVPLNLAWQGLIDPASAADRASGKVVVALEAPLPDPDATVTWETSLVQGAYAMIVGGGDIDTWEWVQGSTRSRAYGRHDDASTSTVAIAWSAVGLGFTHILPKGLDHILFVLGLFLLATRTRTVVIQASVFTVAHSLTLALSIYGVVALPAGIVEPLIAASIVYVAFENLMTSRLSRGRLTLVFAFGLLHGLGFAGVLTDLGLPQRGLLATLIGFNLGVELGQIAVIGTAALLVRAAALPPERYRRLVVRPASALIAVTGVVWVVERLST